MGLFNRKGSKATSDVDSVTSRASRTTSNLQSSAPKKTMNGSSATLPTSTFNAPLPPPPDPNHDPAAYLRSIYAVRERSKYIHDKAKRNQLVHFDVDSSKFEETAAYLVSIIKVSFTWRAICLPWLTFHRETSLRTIIPFLLTAGGSTLKLEAERALTSCSRHGLQAWTLKNGLDDSSTSSWSPSSSMLGRGRNGRTNPRSRVKPIGEVKGWLWPAWRCSRQDTSAETQQSRIKSTLRVSTG